jgi:hypothetical protein
LEKMHTRERMRTRRDRLFSAVYADLDRDYGGSIFLAGIGRSGTTWVSDIINHKNEYRYVFEPFHSGKVKICKGFRRRQYLRPEDRREEFLHPARIILSGGLGKHHWTDQFNSKSTPARRLIKDVRANLMLAWIHANFPELPIVLLLRHPCAVAHSKIKLGWNPNLDEFLSQSELVEDFLEPFADEMRSTKTDFERHLFTWCVESYVPLRLLGHGGVHLAFYEKLCEDPKGEVERLFAFLGKNVDESVFEKMNKPSPLSRPGSAILSGERLVGGWRRHVTPAQLKRAVEILGLFGLDKVYSERAIPNPSGALMATNRSTKAPPERQRKGFGS